MNRRNRRHPRVETLEPRALLSGNVGGTSPDPASSLFVRFASTASPASIAADLAAVDGRIARSYADGPDLVTLARGMEPAAAIRTLRANPAVVYAEANKIIHAESAAVYPNDPVFGRLDSLNAANDVDIDAPEAWKISTGTPATIVAVIDTGIDLRNPDLAGKIWTNPGNDAPTGKPNDLHGWNFVAGNNNVQDDNGHGTHVSGIIAAAGNNGSGTVGVDWNARIMPLKFLDADGNGATNLAVDAIYFAVDHGARVINASWGGVDYSATLRDAIQYAATHGVVFVTAAGNEGTDNDFTTSYPASFRAGNEISVASVDPAGHLAGFSNYGPRTVDIAAPGVNIVGIVPRSISADGLQTFSGTSMSTAYVSGVVALVAGVNPKFTAAELVIRVTSTAKRLPGLAGKVIAGGIVDAYNALAPDAARIAGGIASVASTTLAPGATSDADVRSSILASGEFLAAHGRSAEGFVVGLYRDLLGRDPDPSGLADWVNQFQTGIAGRFEIAHAILTSPEGRAAEVARWYQQDFGRLDSLGALKADPGVQAWAGLLVSGVTDAAVQDSLMASPEYATRHGGTPRSIVAGFYADLVGRDAPAAEQAGWVARLQAGESPAAVLRDFQRAPEVLKARVARWFVQDLGRPASVDVLKADPGVQAWAGLLGNG